eukprot:sb/3465165/
MQTSFLKLIRQSLPLLKDKFTRPEELLGLVVSMLDRIQHCLEHRTLVAPHTVTPLKSLRALSITTITQIYNTFPDTDFTGTMPEVYRVVVDVNAPTLPAESLQSCSPLLLLVESWATTRLPWLHHTIQDSPLFEYVIALLKGKGVAGKVVGKVLTIVTILLDKGDEGVTMVTPFVTQLVSFVYSSLVGLGEELKEKKRKKKKKDTEVVKVKSSSRQTLKQELDLLSRISTLVTSGSVTLSPDTLSPLVSSLLHVVEHGVVWKPTDVVNSLTSLTNLITPSHQPAAFLVCNQLLGKLADKEPRLAVCQLLTRTSHPAAGVVEKLHAWKLLDEPDFDIRLEGYREAGEMLGDGGVDVLLPVVQTAGYTVLTCSEMALRDAASHYLLITLAAVKERSEELYKPILEVTAGEISI